MYHVMAMLRQLKVRSGNLAETLELRKHYEGSCLKERDCMFVPQLPSVNVRLTVHMVEVVR